MFRINLRIIVRAGNHALMAMVKEVLQCVIEQMERNKHAHLPVPQLRCRFFEECQHGTLSFGKVLSGSAMCANRCQHACEKIELIGDKRIDFGKVFSAGI